MAKRYQIDRSQLDLHGACEYWRETFDKVFPDGFTVNKANIRTAMREGFPLNWPGYRLTDALESVYAPQREIDAAYELTRKLSNQYDADDDAKVRTALRNFRDLAKAWERFKADHPELDPRDY